MKERMKERRKKMGEVHMDDRGEIVVCSNFHTFVQLLNFCK